MEIISKLELGTLYVSLKGEMDHHGARDAVGRLDGLILESLPLRCCLDFSAVTFMDSSGIAVILFAYRKLCSYGGSLTVENLPNQPRRVIEAAGLDKLIACELRG